MGRTTRYKTSKQTGLENTRPIGSNTCRTPHNSTEHTFSSVHGTFMIDHVLGHKKKVNKPHWNHTKYLFWLIWNETIKSVAIKFLKKGDSQIRANWHIFEQPVSQRILQVKLVNIFIQVKRKAQYTHTFVGYSSKKFTAVNGIRRNFSNQQSPLYFRKEL